MTSNRLNRLRWGIGAAVAFFLTIAMMVGIQVYAALTEERWLAGLRPQAFGPVSTPYRGEWVPQLTNVVFDRELGRVSGRVRGLMPEHYRAGIFVENSGGDMVFAGAWIPLQADGSFFIPLPQWDAQAYSLFVLPGEPGDGIENHADARAAAALALEDVPLYA